jgi:hypothetical protein
MKRGELLDAIQAKIRERIGGMDDGDRARISITLKLLPDDILRHIWAGNTWEAVAIAAGVLSEPMDGVLDPLEIL